MDLLPPIAAGDLDRSSVAELVAAAFRANATGTLSLEQGTSESRLFVRYGVPCGTLLYVGFRSFGAFLVEQGVLDAECLDRTLVSASSQGRQHGELLVAEGLLTPERLAELLTRQHRENLQSLCMLREGRYEMRGWERPPEWTETIVLDPLRAIVQALSADELFDRRASILGAIGSRKLRRTPEFDDVLSRVQVSQLERRALAAFGVPRRVEEIAAGLLDRVEAEAFTCALALLGAIDLDDGSPVWTPPDPVDDARSTPLSPADDSDSADLLRPLPETVERPRAARAPSLPVEPRAPLPHQTYGGGGTPTPTPTPDAARYGQGAHGITPATSSPPMAAPASISSFFANHALDDGGPLLPPESSPEEFELDVGGDDLPLELDLDRAPRKLEEELRQERVQANHEARQRARQPEARTPEPKPTGPAAPKTKRPAYNPFAAPLESAARRGSGDLGAPGVLPSPEAIVEALDDRLERAMRGERAPRLVAPRARAPERPIPTLIRAPRTAPDAGIMADIEDVVSDLLEDSRGPLTFDEPLDTSRPDGDELALAVARESFDEESRPEEPTTDNLPPSDDDSPALDDAPSPLPEPAVAASGPSGALFFDEAPRDLPSTAPADPAPASAEEAAEEVVEEKRVPVDFDRADATDPEPVPPSGEREGNRDVRRRLLARAFQNVGGSTFSREERVAKPALSHAAAPEEDAAVARPATVDHELEKDVARRLAQSTDAHFARLEIERTATTEQVKEAFLSLAKRFHPDRFTASGQTQLLPQVRELFARIKESYDALVDPASRARFVAQLEAKDPRKKGDRSIEEGKLSHQKAIVHVRRHDMRNAEAELVRAVGADPLPEHLAELAWVLFSQPSRREEAHKEIRDLVARALKAGDHDRAFVVAALVSRADGDVEKAEKYFRKALEKNPKNIEAAREIRLIDSRRKR